MKKNVYLSQVGDLYGKSIYFPYAAGALAAYAWQDDTVKNNYALKDIFYLTQSIDSVIDSMDEPYFVGFSCYFWNYEYNKNFAKRLKERYPSCLILFGGHNIKSNHSDQLNEFDFVDFLIHDEGEVPFKELLLTLLSGDDLSRVSNLSYRKSDGTVAKNPNKYYDVEDFPSPYLSGIFDEMIKNTDVLFNGIFETNRGCPFACAYCDWGIFKTTLRQFPIERVKGDIKWLSDHKIEYCMCADANFGILKRDMEIVDYLIKAKTLTGYPHKNCFCFVKGNDDVVFDINRKLNEHRLAKGATLSIQSFNADALKNVGRTNISLDTFKSLTARYKRAKIPVFSELILGLPGETYESFRDGLCLLFEAGQHTPINVYNCELLMNSKMGQPDYIKKHKIETARTPISSQLHCNNSFNDFPEYSNIIVSTESLTKEDWVKCNVLFAATSCFHGMSLLQFFAQYLHYEKGIKYSSFYEDLLNYIFDSEGTVFNKMFTWIKSEYVRLLSGNGSWGYTDERLGDILWPYGEIAYMKFIGEIDRFFSEITPFLKQYDIPADLFDDMLVYQKNMMRLPGKKSGKITLHYDLHTYFNNIFNVDYTPMKCVDNTVVLSCPDTPDNWRDFAKTAVWFGRRERKMIYIENSSVIYA